MPGGQEQLLEQREEDKVSRTKQGLHENQAGSEEMSPCRHSTRIFAWGNVPNLLDPALSNTQIPRCLAGASQAGSKVSPQRGSFMISRTRGVHFHMDLCFE